jgi:hypothetical protein
MPAFEQPSEPVRVPEAMRSPELLRQPEGREPATATAEEREEPQSRQEDERLISQEVASLRELIAAAPATPKTAFAPEERGAHPDELPEDRQPSLRTRLRRWLNSV